MRKIIGFGLFAALCAAPFAATSADAAIDDVTFSNSSVTTAQCTRAYTLRGIIKDVYFDVPAGKTGAVTLATSEGTFFSVSGVSSDTKYSPRQAVHTTAGAAITEIGGGATNDTANAIYGDIPVAGLVTATFIPQAGTSETNTWAIKIIYDR